MRMEVPMKNLSLLAAAAIGTMLLVTGCAQKEKGLTLQGESTAAATKARPAGVPTPDPSLKKLDKLVGTWSMKGHRVGSDKENIVGSATFHWLEGGFFLQQDVEMDFAGTMRIKSLELIGYDSETRAFASNVYSNLSPVPIPYKWDVQGDTLTISVSYGPLDATFKGSFSTDGRSFSGGWRPNPGADQAINVPYDIGGTRAE
jgi:hypothetical protein